MLKLSRVIRKQVTMVVCGRLKFACAVFVFTIMTRACHAASASGYCPSRTCGVNSGVEIKYPFKVSDDALSTRCYSLYPDLRFLCLGSTFYLNFTAIVTDSADTYKVTNIDYWNQTLSLIPVVPGATCRTFDASRFGGLNITNTTTLLLDCPNDIPGRCVALPPSNFSSICNSTGTGVNGPIQDRWACRMTLESYRDKAYSSCYLMEQDPPGMDDIGAATAVLKLQFGGDRSLSFSNVTSPPEPSPAPAFPPAPPAENNSTRTKKTLYIIFGVIIAVLTAAIICFPTYRWARYRSRRTIEGYRRKHIEKMLHRPTTLYTLKELNKATKNFSHDLKLGSGGFGTVYKGTLDNGVEVAIKRTNRTADIRGISDQYLNEVALLSQVNHRNLVRLHGCCLEVEIPMLVYEYVPNGDLFQHLHGERRGMQLNWKKRLQIAIDTAKALRYLHSAAVRPIYHRDVKTSNILLDDEFNVKVADFGLSKLVEQGITHVTTAVQGTVGYLDPEYFQNFQLTDKSDVYSFGVVLLELVTSLKPVDFQRGSEDVNLKAMALPFIHNGTMEAIADPSLIGEIANESFNILVEMQKVGKLASKCLADKRHDRPSMKEVVAELVAIRGVEHRAGDGSNQIDVIDNEEMVQVPDSQSSNFTSGRDSSYTRHSTSPMASTELVNRQTR